MTNAQKLHVNTDAPQRDLPTAVPAVDIFESADAYLVRADVPGVDASNVDIQFYKGELKVEATRAGSEDGYLAPVSFRRSFELPDGVDNSKIHAALANGVLELRLPKTPEVTPKKISISN